MNDYRKKILVPFLVPLVPLAIALVVIKGVKLFTVALLGLAVWLAWRMAGRAMRGEWSSALVPAGPGGGMSSPPSPPSPSPAPPAAPVSSVPAPPSGAPVASGDLPQAIARAAARRGGSITVAQAVIDTGAAFIEVSTALDRLDRDGYVTAIHRSGEDEVVYRFQEIAPVTVN